MFFRPIVQVVSAFEISLGMEEWALQMENGVEFYSGTTNYYPVYPDCRGLSTLLTFKPLLFYSLHLDIDT